MWKLVLIAAMVATSAPTAAHSVKKGIEAWQRADYSAAVGIWRPLAEAGELFPQATRRLLALTRDGLPAEVPPGVVAQPAYEWMLRE